MRFLFLAVVFVLTSVVRAQSVEFFVDPRAGVDSVGHGSAKLPFKTISYAAGQALPRGTLVILTLRPGVYEAASGEVFPIRLPEKVVVQADPATTSRGGQQVVVDLGSAAVAAFDFTSGGVGSLMLDGLNIEGAFGSGLEITIKPALLASGVVRVTSCHITLPKGILGTVGQLGSLSLYLSETKIAFEDLAVMLVTEDSAAAQCFIDRTAVIGGRSGFVFDARKGGVVTTGFRAVQLLHLRTLGVQSLVGVGAFMAHTFEHCLFHDIGNTVVGLGAVVDSVSASATQPAYRILNGIFDNNRQDAANGTHPSYIWGANLVQQPTLGKLGHNTVGKATFVSTFDDDFHLAPGSLGIDQGLSQDVSLYADFDGDVRLLKGALPDLGPDEYYDWYVYAHAEPHIREILRIRTTTPLPNLAFGLVMSLSKHTGSFGTGKIHLSGTVFPTLTGMTSMSGIGEVMTVLPPDPNLIGLELYWQGGFLAAPYFGVNAWRTVFLK